MNSAQFFKLMSKIFYHIYVSFYYSKIAKILLVLTEGPLMADEKHLRLSSTFCLNSALCLNSGSLCLNSALRLNSCSLCLNWTLCLNSGSLCLNSALCLNSCSFCLNSALCLNSLILQCNNRWSY